MTDQTQRAKMIQKQDQGPDNSLAAFTTWQRFMAIDWGKGAYEPVKRKGDQFLLDTEAASDTQLSLFDQKSFTHTT